MITISASTVTAPSGAITSVWEFEPSGTTFATPVTVTFPVPAGTTAAAAAVYWGKSGSPGQWDVLATTVNGTVATAQVTHFTPGFVGAACAPGATCTPANACHTGVTTCNGTPACADSGTNVADGTACGSGLTCTAGSCGNPGSILIGAWSGSRGGVSGTLTFNANGTFSGDSLSTAGVDVTGNYQATESQLSVVDAGGPQACPQSQVGLYGYVVAGTTLTITLVSDACVGRSLSLPGTYSQGAATCVAGQACTPSGTVDACKNYATACDAGGVQTCVPASDKPDGTTCGSGSTCAAGTCTSLSCNPIPITGSLVSEMRVAETKPAPVGGAIADGIYDLTSDTIYGETPGATGRTERCTLVVSGTVLQEACGTGATGVPTTVNFAVSGNHYTITSGICGTADVGYTVGFTATPTQLWTISDSPGTRVIVYTRRDDARAAFVADLTLGPWATSCDARPPVPSNTSQDITLTFTETTVTEQSWTYPNTTCSGSGTPTVGRPSKVSNIAIGQVVNTTMGAVPVTAYQVNWSGPSVVGGTYYDLFFIDTSTTPWGLHIGANDLVKNGGSPETRPTTVSTNVRYTKK